LRQEHAAPWLTEIRRECLALVKRALPKSALGQALNYTLNQWEKLHRLFDYGEVELSNNLAENSMRPVALGRNYVHSRIMCSRPDSGWRARLAKRGFARLAHATWTKLIGTGRLSIIKASAGTLERGRLADTGTA
jgi:Transposase IS66 family